MTDTYFGRLTVLTAAS